MAGVEVGAGVVGERAVGRGEDDMIGVVQGNGIEAGDVDGEAPTVCCGEVNAGARCSVGHLRERRAQGLA